MIGYLIKNNLKLLLRSAGNLFMYILAPVAVSAVLISAFSSLLASYEVPDEFRAGYTVQSGSFYEMMIPMLTDMASEEGIKFVEYKNADPEEAITKDDLEGFVVFGRKDYVLYRADDTRGQSLNFFLKVFFDNVFYGLTKTEIEASHPFFVPAIDATDYYGIIYAVYFGWCAIVCASRLLSREKKYGIEKKYLVSGMGDLKIYLERVIPTFLAVLICNLIGVTLSIFCLGVKWGNLPVSFMILFMSVLAATALGMFIYYICESNVVTIIVTFMIVWTLGFIGGSFETYMFSTMPEHLKMADPIYHINRALTELSVMGRSEYVSSAMIYTGVMTAVLVAATLLTAKIKRRIKA